MAAVSIILIGLHPSKVLSSDFSACQSGKRFHDLRIELLTCASLQFLQGLAVTIGMPIWAGTNHSIIGIGHRYDSSHERNLLTAASIRIASPIHAFVVS